MKIRDALPLLFDLNSDTILIGTPFLVAASLLGIHRQSLVVEKESLTRERGKALVLGGYQILKALLMSNPKDYGRILYSSCEGYALESKFVSFEVDFAKVLRTFEKTRFGYAAIEDPVTRARALLTIRDAVGLLEKGVLRADLLIREVATPVFSMHRDSALKDVLKEMIERHHRRVFVSSTKGDSLYVVSDRHVLNRLFSPERISEVRRAPQKLLDLTLGDVGPAECPQVEGSASLRFVSKMTRTEEECVVCDEGVVTPWDLIMKPWKMGRLRMGDA